MTATVARWKSRSAGGLLAANWLMVQNAGTLGWGRPTDVDARGSRGSDVTWDLEPVSRTSVENL